MDRLRGGYKSPAGVLWHRDGSKSCSVLFFGVGRVGVVCARG
jgi:hypothetical protein